jgi:hypothetical protein
MRVIDCINIPVDWSTFTPLRFILTDFDVDLIVKGLAKVFLRIVPTILAEKQNDVLPPYLLIQCNVSRVTRLISSRIFFLKLFPESDSNQ